MDVLQDLVQQLKDDLSITWEVDLDEQRKLERTITRAQAWFEARARAKVDWSNPADQGILISRSRLDWNHATEYFEENYHPDLVAFLLRHQEV